jgi:glutaredoxin 3
MAASVQMYSKAGCPFCVRAEALLRAQGVADLSIVRIDLEPARRAEMIERAGRSTVPQIFVGNTHVGGCDDLHDLHARGGLQALLHASA